MNARRLAFQSAVVALAVAGGIVLSMQLRGRGGGPGSGQETATTAVWPAPAPGEAVAGFLDDGTPLLAVAHADGSVTVVEAVSPHVALGVKKILGWCASSRTFDDPFHGSRFDEYGRYLAGPAPTGLIRLSTRTLAGTPTRIRMGAPLPALPRNARALAPHGAFCTGATIEDAGLLIPDSAESGLTPAELVAMAPPAGSRWSVEATLVLAPGEPARLCAAVEANGGCSAGAPVQGISTSTPGEGPVLIDGVWLVLVEGSDLADPIRAG
ncbi:MAG: hypothetical protein M3Q23_11875 [Actinomycetota bacterium]|nr:hypothetical protein [Actinomycetota bacterium]